MNLTASEAAIVQGLVAHWRRSIVHVLQHDPRITPDGRRQYEDDVRRADAILAKLNSPLELVA